MAAYNVGEGRVDRAIKKYKTNDFWVLSRNKRALPAETDNYVPKYIAAKLIAKNPDKYGFDGIDYMPPIEFDHISLDKPMNLRLMAEKMNINYEDFKALNPKFKGEIAPLESNNTLGLRIPPGSYEVAALASKESIVDIVEYVADQKETQNYKIRKGDTFSNIARRYRTTVAYLRDINDFTRKKKLRLGQTILVPDRTPLKQKRPELVAAASKKFHIVQKGENVASIAKKYKTSVSTIRKINRLKSKSNLRVGSRIYLPDESKRL
jgi:membrane-bound lytic murein transglycosylase D